MKRLMILMLMCLSFTTLNEINAQNLTSESVLGINMGLSLAGVLFNLAELEDDITVSNNPAIQLTYDYAINDVISIGAAGSYQRYVLSYTNYDGVENQDFDVKIARTNVAARALFHYGGNEKIDLYSGVRLGLTNWSVDVGADNITDFVPPQSAGIFFAPQLVAFGIKGYFSPNFGVNAELSVGAPHYFSMGISYRFLGKNNNN
ncbi:MAG: porin family protein [Chitinophagales bacterium]|nr:porin family protein [Chitinophagales bacterium]